MPPALLGTNYDKRILGRLPPVRIVNRYVEQAATNQVTGVALLPRPGLAPLRQVGSGPIRGVYREPGLFSGDDFIVSGDELYRNASLVTESGFSGITGTDRVRWAGTDLVSQVFFCADGKLYLYNGTNVTRVTVPDSQLVSDVTEINGYILVQIQTSGRRYFIRPGEATIDALDYFTSESSPDGSVATIALASEVWLIDQKSSEVWLPTGNADLPFQRYEGRIFSRGATSRDSVLSFDNTIFFVGEDNEQGRIVYRAADVPQRISTTTVEERLRLSSDDISAVSFILDGHALVLFSMDEGTWAYDVSTGAWSEWASYERPRFRAHVASAAAGSPTILGDDETNDIYTLDPSRANDNGEPIIRIVGGGLPTLQRQSIDSFRVQCNTGASLDPEARPLIAARFSKDGGNTWGDEKQASLGATGKYNLRVMWRRCGQFEQPGFLFEIIDSDDVQTVMQYATVNEPY